jgi:RNA polymerase sigma-70 factor, ECF subfamily
MFLQDFAGIIEQHQRMVFRTLSRLTGSGDVEDLAQEVFLRLFRGLPGFRHDASVSTFLYRIIVNVVRDEWRRLEQARRSVSIDAEPALRESLAGPSQDPSLQLDQAGLLGALEQCLGELDVEERAALTLFYQEELTYEQVAAALNLPLGTVKTRLHRGRAKLREALKERMTPCRTSR